jgi:hypothetical protein
LLKPLSKPVRVLEAAFFLAHIAGFGNASKIYIGETIFFKIILVIFAF